MQRMIRPFTCFSLLLLLSGCNSPQDVTDHNEQSKDMTQEKTTISSIEKIQQHKWVLDELNQNKLKVKSKAYFNIAADMTVAGYAGCNRFRGHGEVENGRFYVKHFVMTRMACISDEVTAIEDKIRTNFASGVTVQEVTDQQLLVQGKDLFKFISQ